MLRFLADENLDNDILEELSGHQPSLDIVRVQDVGLRTINDPAILEWAAQHNRILLTHDVRTMTKFAYDRIVEGKTMPGVVEIKKSLPIGKVVEDLILLAECGKPEDVENKVEFLPL